jgi:hypothetical protein
MNDLNVLVKITRVPSHYFTDNKNELYHVEELLFFTAQNCMSLSILIIRSD